MAGGARWKVSRTSPARRSPRASIGSGNRFPSTSTPSSRSQWTVDVGTQIAHGAVRAYVMGDRGARNEPATPDDIDAMREIVRDAIVAGALGFSTSRTIAHRAIDGEPVPGTYAAEDELFGIGSALGDLGAGVFELAPAGVAGEDVDQPGQGGGLDAPTVRQDQTARVVRADPGGRRPDLWRGLMAASLGAVDDGADLWPQVAGRATGLLSGLETTYCMLDVVPAYQELKAKSCSHGDCSSARCGLLRCARRSSNGSPMRRRPTRLDQACAATFLLGDPPDYEPGPERSLARTWPRRPDAAPLEMAYDALFAGRRNRAVLCSDPQLLRREPRTGPRDAAAPPFGLRARRRWRPLRRDL